MFAYYEDFLDLDSTLWGYFAKNNHCIRNFHQRLELCYIASGQKKVIIGSKEYTVTADDIVFIPKYAPHEHSEAKDCTDYVFCLPISSTVDLEDIFKKTTLPFIMQNKDFNRQKILPLIQELYNYNKSDKSLIVRSYVNIIFSLLLEKYPKNNESGLIENNIITDVLTYIENNYMKNITLDDLSKQFGYNKFYFSKLFNNQLKVNIKTYINSVRTKHLLNRLITSPKENISELIFDVGFSSSSSFYRFFGEHYKTSPKEFLRKL